MSQQPYDYQPQPQYPYPQQPQNPYAPQGGHVQPYAAQPYQQQYGVQPYAGYSQPYVAPKSPGISLLASFFIPGLGSMINGETGKGAGILVGYIACLVGSVLLFPLLVAAGLWVWGMVDAYQGAQRWNAQHGIMS